MRFPFDKWELKDKLQALQIALLRSGGGRRRIPSREEKTVQDFGRTLFEVLLEAAPIAGNYEPEVCQ